MTDITDLSIAYEDAKDKEVKYQIALFIKNYAEEHELEPYEKETAVNIRLREGLVREGEDPILENFPDEEPEPHTEADRKLQQEERKLKRLDEELHEAYIRQRSRDVTEYNSVRFEPKAAIKRVLPLEVIEDMRERQEEGHTLYGETRA